MNEVWFLAFILQWILLLFLAVLILGILRYLASLQEVIAQNSPDSSRFKLGERVVDFELSDKLGRLFRSKEVFIGNQRTILFFLSSSCGPCRMLVQLLTELSQREGGLKQLSWNFVLVCTGEQAMIESLVRDLPIDDLTVLFDKDGTITNQYGIRSTPFAISIDTQGELYSQSAQPASHWLYTILNIPAPAASDSITFDQNPVPVLRRAYS